MRGPLRIAVVGCGIAGTSFSILARRAGHEVVLFERTGRVGPVGAGVLLQPSGQRVLEKMGLLADVTARAERVHQIHAVTHRGRNLVQLHYADGSPGTHAYGLHRGDLFTVLHNALLAAGVELCLGQSIESHSAQGDRAALLDATGVAHGPFDLIVAADGGRSRLRETSGIPSRSYEYPYGALWAVGRCNAVRNKLWQITSGTRRLCGLLPMGESRCSLFWGLRQDEYQLLVERGAWDQWKRDVLALAPAAEEVFNTLDLPADLTFTTFRHVVMSQSAAGNLVFIGDAAHATSPHLGQGVNLALLDAWILADQLERQGTIAAALAEYIAQRRKQLRYYSLVTGWLSPFFQSDGWLRALGRDLFLPHFASVPPMRRMMLTTLRGDAFAGTASIVQPVARELENAHE